MVELDKILAREDALRPPVHGRRRSICVFVAIGRN